MPELARYDVTRDTTPPLLDGIFLGWMPSKPPCRSMVIASKEDSVAILGPPRVGKTSGVLIPQAMLWPGPLIAASTKPDVLRATRRRRLDTACARGGDVFVYSPSDPRESIYGVRAIRWSPIDGCEDPTVCEVRVQKMLGPEKPTEQVFFRQAGATIIRGFFHAAALTQCGMRRVKSWIDSMSVDEAVEMLQSFRGQSHAAVEYASALEGIGKQAPETKAGSFGTVNEKLAAIVGNATALANADHGDFDINKFIETGSSLYIVSPEDTQAIIAPLVAGLIEAIVSRAYQLASIQLSGRLEPGLLLLLDEVGAIAPLQSLPQIMGQGAGQGVLCVWAAQSFNQLKARWGDDWANSIWGASSQKLVFGGLADADLLERISQSFGEFDRRISPHASRGQALAAALAKQHSTPHLVQTRKVQVSELHGVPPGSTNLIAMTPQGPDRLVLHTPPAAQVHPFASLANADAGIDLESADPDVLRESAMFDLEYSLLPLSERRRYQEEHEELNNRLAPGSAAPPRGPNTGDPQLALELAAAETLMRQPPLEQLKWQRLILHRFARREIPHFTYTVIEVKESPRKQPLRRSPDRY